MEDLSELATIYPNVKILHFEVDLRNNRLDFKVVSLAVKASSRGFHCVLTFLITYQFHLKDGPRHVPHYGLLLAGVAGLPSCVIEAARNITVRITEEVTSQLSAPLHVKLLSYGLAIFIYMDSCLYISFYMILHYTMRTDAFYQLGNLIRTLSCLNHSNNAEEGI